VTDGPSVEADLWQYYRGRSPGQIEVLAPDLFDGTAAQLTQFKNETGATFPLLLNGAAGAGNENLFTVYGDRDNYAVVSKQGIVRYNAFNFWPYGARYHLDELRGCIDSLLTVTTDVDGGNAPHAFGLAARPNPARGAIVLELANPSEQALTARVEIYDLAGRPVAAVYDGLVPHGRTPMTWTGRGAGGQPVAPGVYLVRARIGGAELTRRVLRLP
jgi:hypothetical protein